MNELMFHNMRLLFFHKVGIKSPDQERAVQESRDFFKDFHEGGQSVSIAHPHVIEANWFLLESSHRSIADDIARLPENRRTESVGRIILEDLHSNSFEYLNEIRSKIRTLECFVTHRPLLLQAISLYKTAIRTGKSDLHWVIIPALLSALEATWTFIARGNRIATDQEFEHALHEALALRSNEVIDKDAKESHFEFERKEKDVRLNLISGVANEVSLNAHAVLMAIFGNSDKRPTSFTRNTVMHGVNVTYATTENSAKLLLLTRYLAHIYELFTNEPPENPKYPRIIDTLKAMFKDVSEGPPVPPQFKTPPISPHTR